jgi:hypothetical protein
VTDSARVLLTAALLSASALAVFAWRVNRIDAAQPHRIVGELWLAQWAAILLATIGGTSIGFAVAATGVPAAHLDVALGVGFVVAAAIILRRDPHDALLLAALAFVVQALVDVAHRPGLLSPDLAPRWYTAGCAIYSLYVAAICYWTRRR